MLLKEILVTFIGAFQACVSVLLTMGYGVAAQKLQLIQETSIDDMAGLGVKLFLPALIIVHLGGQLHADNVLNYPPIVVWAVIYTFLSIGIARVLVRVLKLPHWVAPACAFNNTTSLPLFLLQSLQSVGSLRLILKEEDRTSEAIKRAQSYFLICAVVSKTIGYVMGPKMLHKHGEHDEEDEEDSGDVEDEPADTGQSDEYQTDEETPLMSRGKRVRTKVRRWRKYISSFFPERIKQDLIAPFESPFADTAIVCTLIGAILGLVPQLHKVFFNPYNKGGIFNAWLTSSVSNIGGLFVTMQVFIVGCKLGVSFKKMKDTGNSGKIPFRAIAVIFLVRLVLWPILSISVIYELARRTELVRHDSMLWFSMMLMPAGPPALVLAGLAELTKTPEEEKMAIAKTLTVMYALSPFICFTITGALKASQAALESR